MAMRRIIGPRWLQEFRRLEAEGHAELRPGLLRELKEKTGISMEIAERILDGFEQCPADVSMTAMHFLGYPTPDAYRACRACYWIGVEKRCDQGTLCPHCGKETYLLPV